MKKTKQTLAFEQLEAEMELISRSEQLTFSGGTGGTAQDLVNAMSSSGQSYYGASSNSNYDYSSGGYTYGSNGQPSSSYYGSNSNSNSSNGYSSNSYSSNSYSSNSYSSNSYSSGGYSSSGYGSSGSTNSVGGSVVDGPMDCVFRAVAFATGKTVLDVQADYVGFYNQRMDAAGYSAEWHRTVYSVGRIGVDSTEVSDFLFKYGLNSGYTSPVANGQSGNVGQGVILVSGSPGHAYNITGMASPFEYNTYDPQNQTTGTILISDPSIVGVFGKHPF